MTHFESRTALSGFRKKQSSEKKGTDWKKEKNILEKRQVTYFFLNKTFDKKERTILKKDRTKEI